MSASIPGLVLKLEQGEVVTIGDGIVIEVVEVGATKKARLAIKAPRGLSIGRGRDIPSARQDAESHQVKKAGADAHTSSAA
ncbi:MAG TPA: carbon storage regulator [Phycisphaerales bacterium]|nr:carbon storage regulator [Phycisphaerales bacterium]